MFFFSQVDQKGSSTVVTVQAANNNAYYPDYYPSFYPPLYPPVYPSFYNYNPFGKNYPYYRESQGKTQNLGKSDELLPETLTNRQDFSGSEFADLSKQLSTKKRETDISQLKNDENKEFEKEQSIQK